MDRRRLGLWVCTVRERCGRKTEVHLEAECEFMAAGPCP